MVWKKIAGHLQHKTLLSRGVTSIRNTVNKAFTKHLLLTNVSISMALSGVGDVCQQQYQVKSGRKSYHSLSRTAHMAGTGVTVGALCHFWYQYLDRILPGRSGKIIAKKIIVDQILFSPICLLTFFVTLEMCRNLSKNQLLNSTTINSINLGKINVDHKIDCKSKDLTNDVDSLDCANENSLTDFLEEVKTKGVLLYLSEWVVWPPAQLVNFYFLPTRFRVLYDNSVSLLYDVYTSHVCYDMEVKKASQFLQISASDDSTNHSNHHNIKL